MATAILLYNGLHFPGAIADKGIAWAIETGGNIIALFILSDKDQEEGYPFPNDLDESEDVNTNSDAMGQDLIIIASNIRLLRHQAKSAAVKLETQILPSVSKNTLQTWLKKGEIIYAASDPLDPPVLSIDKAKLKTILTQIKRTIEWVE